MFICETRQWLSIQTICQKQRWKSLDTVCYVVIVITGYITSDKDFLQLFNDSLYLFLIALDVNKLVMYGKLLSME